MSRKQYEEHRRKMCVYRGMNGKAAKSPIPARRDVRASKWTSAERSYFYGVLGGVGEYEGVELRITPDQCERHVYTPDFVTESTLPIYWGDFESTQKVRVFHEVKGTYRLGSQDGARLRWTFAAIANPDDVFVWAKQCKTKKGRWDVEVWFDGGRTRIKARGVSGFGFDGKGGVAWRK